MKNKHISYVAFDNNHNEGSVFKSGIFNLQTLTVVPGVSTAWMVKTMKMLTEGVMSGERKETASEAVVEYSTLKRFCHLEKMGRNDLTEQHLGGRGNER